MADPASLASTPGFLGVIDVLTIAVVSGAFGGFTYVCTKISIKEKAILYSDTQVHWWPLLFITFTSVIAGIASAVGLLFILHFVDAFSLDTSTKNILFLISVSLIAGIAAPQLIPKYVDAVDAKILNAKMDAVEKTSAQSKDAAQEATLVARAVSALRPQAPTADKVSVAGLIKDHLEKAPLTGTTRSLVIYRGRLLRSLGDYVGAMAALEDFLKKKEAAGQRDKDYADVTYNLACYCKLESAKNKPELLQKALDYLKKSVEISSENKGVAIEDGDFGELRNDPRFIEITKS